MSRVDEQIQLKGLPVEIHRDSGATIDGYGDKTPAWAKVADEYVLIQMPRRSLSWDKTEAGVFDTSTRAGFFTSDSVVQERDLVVIGSAKLSVESLTTITGAEGEASHLEAVLRILEEG
jgi:hypothetical protein